jgi:hypothetical protein
MAKMNVKSKFRILKVDPQFRDAIQEIKIKRWLSKIDTKFKSDRRITKALWRHALFSKLAEDVIKADLPEE